MGAHTGGRPEPLAAPGCRVLRWAPPDEGPLARAGRGQRMRRQAMPDRMACQTVWRSARAKAAPPYRLHNAMTARTPLSTSARRVFTTIKMRHAVIRLSSLETIFEACA